MRCDEAKLLIPSLLLGDIAADERAALTEHLSACADCRQEAASLRIVPELLKEPHLAATPSPDLKISALARVAADDLATALAAAPLPAPPPDLKQRAIARALEPAVSERKRTRVPTLIAAAAAVIGIGFAVDSRMDMQGLDRRVDTERAMRIRAESALGPAGHPMQDFLLTGRDASAEAQLVHFKHDNFRVTMTLSNFKPCPADHHYELWLQGTRGVVGLGTFRIVRPDELTLSFSVGVDPAEFPEVLATLEPNDGDPRMSKDVVARAVLDETAIHHGEYDE